MNSLNLEVENSRLRDQLNDLHVADTTIQYGLYWPDVDEWEWHDTRDAAQTAHRANPSAQLAWRQVRYSEGEVIR